MLHTPAVRRCGAVTVATAVAMGMLAVHSGAQAAVETCRGVPATIVGSPGARLLSGTGGADVIVSNGSALIGAGDGDDIICLTAAKGPRESVIVHAGAGNDQVTNLRNGPTTHAQVDLGPGDDVYTGSNGEDAVGQPGTDFNGGGSDQIRTGAGNDTVSTGERIHPNTDTVDLGDGKDELVILATDNRAATLLGGHGTDQLTRNFMRSDQPGAWRFDNSTRAATVDGAPMMTWSAFEHFNLLSIGYDLDLSFVGSPASETLTFQSWWTDVAMGGGDDTIIGRRTGFADNSMRGSRLAGGSGRDDLQFLADDPDVTTTAIGDLARGLLISAGEGTANDFQVPLAGIEDLAFVGREVTVKGNNSANRLQVSGCDVTAVGRGGDDRIVRAGRDRFAGTKRCLERLRPSRLVGGTGDDRLTGNSFVDALIGGPGRDRADGRNGRDTCRAEVELSCARD